MTEPLLGGQGATPATVEEKREFRDFCRRLPLLTRDELARMQRIEWGLTLHEYNVLKFGE